MSSMNILRKVKKPTVVVKRGQRGQLKKKKTGLTSIKLLNEKLKFNNSSLAKALSKQKEESQYLYTENLSMRGQIQDYEIAFNANKNFLTSVLHNSSEALKLLVKATTHITNNIVGCQQILGTAGSVSSRNNSNNRDSLNRQSGSQQSGKSPARGVVQPMVSGHTITKPVINLSRISMSRTRNNRISTDPNLSNIEERLPSPETSPIRPESRITTRRLNQRSSNSTNRSIIQQMSTSPTRLSGENSSNDVNDRRSRRYSGNRTLNSRPDLNQSSSQESSSSPIVRSAFNPVSTPFVSLEDVSTYIRRSQNEIQEHLNGNNEIEQVVDAETPDETPDPPTENVDDTSEDTTSYRFDLRERKIKLAQRAVNVENEVLNAPADVDDPLEGSSWWYNNGIHRRDKNLSCYEPKSTKKNVSSRYSRNLTTELSLIDDDELDFDVELSDNFNEDGRRDLSSFTALLNKDKRQRRNDYSDNDASRNTRSENYDQVESQESAENSTHNSNDNENENDNSEEELINIDDNEDEEETEDDNDEQTCNYDYLSNITNKRGSNVDNDDFTMVFRKKPTQRASLPRQNNELFNFSQLDLPDLENSLVKEEDMEPEPELTANVRAASHNAPSLPIVIRENLMNSTNYTDQIPTVLLPMNVTKTFSDPSDDTQIINFNVSHNHKRKRIYQLNLSSGSEPSPGENTQKKNQKSIRESLRKSIRTSQGESLRQDPRSVSVVIEKMSKKSKNNSVNKSANNSSIDRSDSSDSSSSIANSRPRRNKAPINFKEPNLHKKLRRD